ncbi:DUF3667 domain-containing protein [Sediminicola luteus]|uniref:DUF3667 domain-containing protein n=1 Tax=Sediminicola luteus TaxID=319238 RepID=A0A2A4G609_9FLAO|nr:DUF3667 domain-containing protein [Sediminicola luteus]PCE63420.1 hypothetical protein B7P33_14495 [Sediminicola luteus]
MANKLRLPSKFKRQKRYLSKYRGVSCLNCGQPLKISHRYCPNCSQANTTKPLSLQDFIDEFFSSLVSYDSKLLRTLKALLLKPGKISLDFIAGKRITYTNPFRFLLSLSIIYFLLLNTQGDFDSYDKFGYDHSDPNANAFNSLDIFGPDTGVNASVELDSLEGIDRLKNTISKSEKRMLNNSVHFLDSVQNLSFFDRMAQKQFFFNTVLRKDKVDNFYEIAERYEVPETRENKFSLMTSKGILKTSQRPGSFFSDFVSKLPFLVFFFLPVFSLFLKVAYIRKKHSYTDHLIFSFHNQSLLFILLILSAVLDYFFAWSSIGFFLMVFGIYLFLSMKKFYKQGFFKTFVKYSALNTIFFTLALLSVTMLLLGAAFTY